MPSEYVELRRRVSKVEEIVFDAERKGTTHKEKTATLAELNRLWDEAVAIGDGVSGRKIVDLRGRLSRVMIDEIGSASDNGQSLQAKPESSESQTVLKADVLLVTVTEVEARAVLNEVKTKYNREPQPHYLGPKTYYDLGGIGGVRTFMVRSEMGAVGLSGSTTTVFEALERLGSSAVIMVGIAFGVDHEKQRIGDILVSRQLVEYELQRVGTDREGKPDIIPRGDRVSASPRLLDRFRDGELSWQGAPVKFGLILSGLKLVDNLDLRDQLRRHEPEAMGGEMEGAGLYDAAQFHRADWILVKAICDWADGKKYENKSQRQQEAARNAAQFVIHVLARGGLAEVKTQTSSDGNRVTTTEVVSGDKTTVRNVAGTGVAIGPNTSAIIIQQIASDKGRERISPSPELRLKLYKMERDRTRRDEIMLETDCSLPQLHQFGLALENMTEATLAKGISIRVEFSWRGHDISSAPSFWASPSSGWVAQVSQLVNEQSAVLTFRDPDLACFYGQPIEWDNVRLKLREHMRGYLLVHYRISSVEPHTDNSGELRIVLGNK